MKLKNKIHKYRNSLMLALALVIAIAVTGCVYIDSVSVMQIYDGKEVSYAYAGDEATFTIQGHIESSADINNDKFVVGFLAPKGWNVAKNAKVTYKSTLGDDRDKLYTMSVVSSTELPKNGNGRTWVQCLTQEYGVGPNYVNDMEWVVFETDQAWDIKNGDKPTYTIYIKTNVGTQNLRCHLGFFVNHTDDGFSGGNDHKKVTYSSECFEVVGGEGDVIDFCNLHANKVAPSSALQDDYVTFSFLSTILDNDLAGQDPYFEATAYTESGKTYVVNEKTSKTLMKPDKADATTYNITIWPAKFFNIPEGETLRNIVYVFTNKDRSVIVGDETNDDGTQKPFTFTLKCQ